MGFSKPPPGFGSAGEMTFRRQPSTREAGKVQCLGETPWESRATAFEPDAVHVGQTAAKVNQPPRLCAGAAQSTSTCTELMTFSVVAPITYNSFPQSPTFAPRFGSNRYR